MNEQNQIHRSSLPQRVLIIRTDRLGDVVLTLPMASAIKAALPNSDVAFLVREYTRPIVERARTVDEAVVTPDEIGLIGLIALIRKAKANTVFFPAPRFQLALAGFLARVPVRVGTGYRWYSFLFNRKVFEHRKTAEHHEAEYNLRMLSAIGIAADANLIAEIDLRPEEVTRVNEWQAEHLGSSKAKYIVLHAVSGGSTHEWSTDRFVELGKELRARISCEIVLTGLASDRHKLHGMAVQTGAHLFVGQSLADLAALLSQAAAAVSVGTGPGHLSAALGTPTIGLFVLPKTISKERWGMRGAHVANLTPAPIPGCPDCQDCTCMERIEVLRVADEVERLIQSVVT